MRPDAGGLRWLRSWPTAVPGGRAHVHDHLPRLHMSGHDYLTAELPDDEPGWCLLEWDVALASEERARFAALALEAPGRVLVAPYHIYPVAGPPAGVHRTAGRPIPEGAPAAETFGLGCVYLPQPVLRAFMASTPPAFTDRSFSRWHLAEYGPAGVTWEVHPQHLHGD